MFKKRIFALLLCFIAGTVFGHAEVYVDSLFFQSVGRTMPLSIVIPSCYDNKKPMPILYLLHGHGLNHEWFVKNTDIEKYVEEDSMICVMPQADNSWWINSYSVPEDRFEDYLTIDITEYIEHKYNIDQENQLLGMDMLKEAIAIFQLNIELYPESSNVYDSLGEVFEKANKPEQAAENYKKAYDIGVEQSSNSVNVYKGHLDRVLNKIQKK
jgi:tetratricopeptide (TPR) repeat protein